jgi:hypothetical protein
VTDQRVDVPGADHLDDSGGQVGLGVQAGGEPVGVEFVQEDGGAGHHGGRGVALGGVGAQHDPQLAHDGGGVRVVTLDVPDDRADPAAPGRAAPGQRDQVVPVAADVPAEGGRAVAHGDVGAAHAGDGAGQHGLLEALGEVLLLFVEHGPHQALRDAAAERDQDGALLGGEAAPVVVEQAHRADRAGLGDQREVGGRGDAQAGQVRPQEGVVRGELLR